MRTVRSSGRLSGAMSAPGGGGGGGVVSQPVLRQTPPPPCGQTDACKNITFATSLRTVKILPVVEMVCAAVAHDFSMQKAGDSGTVTAISFAGLIP